jgi:hypothetical protein
MRAFLLSAAALTTLAACAGSQPVSMEGKFTIPPAVSPTVVPFILEGDQILLEVEAEGPKGIRKLLVNLNMGNAYSGWMQHVYDEVGQVHGQPVKFRIGGIPVEVASGASGVVPDAAYPDRQWGFFFFTHPLEGTLQCGVLQNFDISLDYQQKTLTLASPGTLPHEGVPIPIRTKPETGVSTVDFMVDGKAYPMVIDVGGPYTWVRHSTSGEWLKAHPEWRRATGAVGAVNYGMTRYSGEEEGTVMRLDKAALGPMEIDNVGIFGVGGGMGPLNIISSETLYDTWQKGAPEPVVAWLGANVLKHYRLTVDYKAHMSWWKKLSDFDPHELDQVGLEFAYDKGVYSIARIVDKDGRPTAKGVESGDKLVAVDEASTQGWSRDQLFGSLGGKPGDTHRLTIERDGKSLMVSLPVISF